MKADLIKELLLISEALDKRGLFLLASQLDNIIKLSMPLSDKEREQLGTPHPTSRFDYIDAEKWEKVRSERAAIKENSKSYKQTSEFIKDPELTAFTPGETLDLLSHPKILEWFDKINNYRIPSEYKHIILVPCAASKPWGANCPASGKYYKAYHDIKKSLGEEGKLAFWVTISEPLGIVPEDMWDSFPGYDVPGLFKDPSQRMNGMTTKDWVEMFGEKFSTPFDIEAYNAAIKKLGSVIGSFIKNNDMPGRRWISFIKGTKGKVTTHTEMINEAMSFLEQEGIPWSHSEYTKDKDELGHPTRTRIRDHISGVLKNELENEDKY